MATKKEKKNIIRERIINASEEYSSQLAGKTFLYVYGEKYFELWFSTESFAHLTGVNTTLSARDFYGKCLDRKLACGQFFFDNKHRYDSAKRKLDRLINLSILTNQMVCVVEDLKTVTFTYRIGITDLDFTLALTENTDSDNNKINDWLKPRSLRTKDKAIELSGGGDVVDFIFVKRAEERIYKNISFRDETKSVPKSIKHLISRDFYN